jgi:hypothetical protein
VIEVNIAMHSVGQIVFVFLVKVKQDLSVGMFQFQLFERNLLCFHVFVLAEEMVHEMGWTGPELLLVCTV